MKPSVCISPGLFLESNFAVPAPKVRELLGKVQRAELPGMGPIEVRPASPASGARDGVAPPAAARQGGIYTFQFQIPVEITVKVGGAVVASGGASDRLRRRPGAGASARRRVDRGGA